MRIFAFIFSRSLVNLTYGGLLDLYWVLDGKLAHLFHYVSCTPVPLLALRRPSRLNVPPKISSNWFRFLLFVRIPRCFVIDVDPLAAGYRHDESTPRSDLTSLQICVTCSLLILVATVLLLSFGLMLSPGFLNLDLRLGRSLIDLWALRIFSME